MKIVNGINSSECLVDFDGRRLILSYDRGQVAFINHSVWEDGTIPTPNERVQIIKEIYAENRRKKR